MAKLLEVVSARRYDSSDFEGKRVLCVICGDFIEEREEIGGEKYLVNNKYQVIDWYHLSCLGKDEEENQR